MTFFFGNGCSHPNLNGSWLENQVKQLVRSLLSLETEEFYQRIANQTSRQELRESLQRELKSLDDKLKRNINAETDLLPFPAGENSLSFRMILAGEE